MAVVPASVMRSGRTDVVFLEIADNPLPDVEIYQVWRPDAPSAALRLFLEHTDLLQR